MSYEVTQHFTALLAVLAGVTAVVLIIGRFVPGARAVLEPFRQAQLWLAWLVTATAMAGSLYFSEHFGLKPCRLCWFQRIAMFPLALILLIAALRKDSGIRWYAVALAGVGAAVAFWHQLVEWNPQLESTSCQADTMCSVPYFRVYGFVSLSFMALCGFVAVIALLTLTPAHHPPTVSSPDDTPPTR